MSKTATRSTQTSIPRLRRATKDDGEPTRKRGPKVIHSETVARRRAAVLAAWRSITGGDAMRLPRLAQIVQAVEASDPEWAGVPSETIRSDLRRLTISGAISRPLAGNRARGSKVVPYHRGAGKPDAGPSPPRKPVRSRRGPERWTLADADARLALRERLGEAALWLAGGDPSQKFAPVVVDRAAIAGWVREDKVRRGRRAKAKVRRAGA